MANKAKREEDNQLISLCQLIVAANEKRITLLETQTRLKNKLESAREVLSLAEAQYQQNQADLRTKEIQIEEARKELTELLVQQKIMLEEAPDITSRLEEEEIRPRIPDPDEIELDSPIEVNAKPVVTDQMKDLQDKSLKELMNDVFGITNFDEPR